MPSSRWASSSHSARSCGCCSTACCSSRWRCRARSALLAMDARLSAACWTSGTSGTKVGLGSSSLGFCSACRPQRQQAPVLQALLPGCRTTRGGQRSAPGSWLVCREPWPHPLLPLARRGHGQAAQRGALLLPDGQGPEEAPALARAGLLPVRVRLLPHPAARAADCGGRGCAPTPAPAP